MSRNVFEILGVAQDERDFSTIKTQYLKRAIEAHIAQRSEEFHALLEAFSLIDTPEKLSQYLIQPVLVHSVGLANEAAAVDAPKSVLRAPKPSGVVNVFIPFSINEIKHLLPPNTTKKQQLEWASWKLSQLVFAWRDKKINYTRTADDCSIFSHTVQFEKLAQALNQYRHSLQPFLTYKAAAQSMQCHAISNYSNSCIIEACIPIEKLLFNPDLDWDQNPGGAGASKSIDFRLSKDTFFSASNLLSINLSGNASIICPILFWPMQDSNDKDGPFPESIPVINPEALYAACAPTTRLTVQEVARDTQLVYALLSQLIKKSQPIDEVPDRIIYNLIVIKSWLKKAEISPEQVGILLALVRDVCGPSGFFSPTEKQKLWNDLISGAKMIPMPGVSFDKADIGSLFQDEQQIQTLFARTLSRRESISVQESSAEKGSRIGRLASSVFHLNRSPTSFADIQKNQYYRADAAMAYQSDNNALQGKDLAAVKKFWSTQVYFFIQLIAKNHEMISKTFPEIVPAKMDWSKKELLLILTRLTDSLKRKDARCALLIDLICSDNLAPKDLPRKKQESVTPALFIRNGDSIQFAREQAEKGRRVLIMDAANRQRPGDSACKKGTFQEALTRELDPYYKTLAHFRNVLSDLKESGQLAVAVDDASIRGINVQNYQMDFLRLIVTFCKHAIEDEQYFASPNYKKDFFEAADNIYGRMQNCVFEIPFDDRFPSSIEGEKSKSVASEISASADISASPEVALSEEGIFPKAGFLKHARFARRDIQCSGDLFTGTTVKPAVLDEETPRLLIVETAAPDKRKVVGAFDRSCTFHRELQSDGLNDSISERVVMASLDYTIQAAIRCDADIILLNGFGCKAFENDPQVIAKQMAQKLLQYRQQLADKQIYFMDLNDEICMTFGACFSGLSGSYRVNPYQISPGVCLSVLPAPLVAPCGEATAVLTASRSKADVPKAKSGGLFASSHKTFNIDLSGNPKTKQRLIDAYDGVLKQLEREGCSTLHLPLIGSGKLGFALEDCIHALITSLKKNHFPDHHIDIKLYVPDQEKFSSVITTMEAEDFASPVFNPGKNR
jgi:hypothetical protein